LLRRERGVRVPVVPDAAHVRQETLRGFDRREPRRVLGGAPRQNGRRPVDPRVHEPALARRDEPPRHLRPPAPRDLAERPWPVPERIGRSLAVNGRVEQRREQRACLDLAGPDELRHLEHARVSPALERRRGYDGVRGAEIDPDGETRGHE
jgi:hypothetical protein